MGKIISLENYRKKRDDEVFAAVNGAENFYWYSTDVRGSSSSILKSDSTANHGVKRIRDFSYDAYGSTTDTLQNTTDTEMDEIAYTGGVFDKELGLYYLMSRYYDPMIAQFISEDSYRGDGEHFWNLYMYCEGDPINRTDRNGHYSRNAAVSYARKWANSRNPNYRSYRGGDCANFVSQCLYAGGLVMTEKWHSYRKLEWFHGNYSREVFDVTPAWRLVKNFMSYFVTSRYCKGIVEMKSSSDVTKKNGKIKIGDIALSAKPGKGYGHAMIVSKKSKSTFYICGHTNNRKDKNIKDFFANNSVGKVMVFRLRDNAR